MGRAFVRASTSESRKIMSRMRTGDKANRVLQLLRGLRNKEAMAEMGARGFTNDELNKGWELLRGVSCVKLDTVPAAYNEDALAQLDAWENLHFPVADAMLQHRFPAVHAHMFANLRQAVGIEVMVSVGTFIRRYDLMVEGAAPYGAEGPAAVAVLAARGIDTATIDKARALLAVMSSLPTSADLAPTEAELADLAEAEKRLWAWYLEWSRIARATVRSRKALREMGFLPRKRAASAGAEETEEMVDEAAPTSPAPAVGGGAVPLTTPPTAPSSTNGSAGASRFFVQPLAPVLR